MRNLNLLLILMCLSSLTQAQHTALDSLYKELKNHPENDTAKVDLLTSISAYSWGTDPQKIKDYADQALVLARDLNYTKGTGDAYRGIGMYYWSQTEYNRAMDFQLMAVKEYERCNYQEGIAWCYGSIGLNYSQANDHDKSIHYHSLALALNRKLQHKKGIARDLNNLGYAYELKKDYRRSLDYYQEALNMRVEIGVRSDIIMPQSNVGAAYLCMGDHARSLPYFFKSLALAKEFNNKNMIALNYQNLGEASYKGGNYKGGEKYLQQALVVAKEIGDKKRREETYQILTTLEETRKNYSAALRYLKLLQGVRDTLYTQERTRQMAEMETRFETAKKEQAIHLLEQEKRIQALWRNILIGGLALIVIALAIAYLLQRYHAKKNRAYLNLQIDFLTARQHELTEKYKHAITRQDDRPFETNDQRFLKRALEIVEKNIADPLFGVEKMSEEMGMSRANLHRKLKSITCFSPSDFIRSVRLRQFVAQPG